MVRDNPCKLCIACSERMNGIHSHKIRQICSPCGGFALDDKGKEIRPAKRVKAKKARTNV